ncbi:SDR family NAD(P)-dependent oxidoreductase [Microbacterium sp. NPDC090007]|uniref:SDR family NAD(P)-dependent oxidoreductase n=1 Tax=Microbacterium sp. NPDC090007 TaxID=3364204 RepID=UPI00382441E2
MSAWTGLRVVVTGGASGIGRATGEAFLDAGAHVAILDVSDHTPLTGAVSVTADLRDRGEVSAAIDLAAQSLGGIDVLVNNAGISAIGTVEDNDDAEWARVLDINVVGMARASAAALPWLRRSERAAIVNVCSIAAHNGLPDRALYSASKGAVLSLTLAMATDHVADGIRVNAVSPGTVHTPFVDRMLSRFDDPVAERAALDARQATGHLVSSAEVAATILHAANPSLPSLTGANIDIDGGVTRLRVRR